jgi:hypothetical protein
MLPPGAALRVDAEGLNIDGDFARTTALLPLGPAAPGAQRLKSAGLVVRLEGDKTLTELPEPGTAAAKAGIDLDWTITALAVPARQPAKEWLFVPAFVLLGGVVAVQRARRRAAAGAPAS